jgi:hypothetical protein
MIRLYYTLITPASWFSILAVYKNIATVLHSSGFSKYLSDGAGGIFFRVMKNNKSDFCISSRSILLHRGLSHSQLFLDWSGFCLLPTNSTTIGVPIIISHKKRRRFCIYQKVAATTTKVFDFICFLHRENGQIWLMI